VRATNEYVRDDGSVARQGDLRAYGRVGDAHRERVYDRELKPHVREHAHEIR
jgi:hypothetical protein